MRFSLSTAGLQDWNGDVLVVGLLQDQPATDLEARFPGLGAALAQQQFKGKPSEQLLINPVSYTHLTLPTIVRV